jgi:hypothetical protein
MSANDLDALPPALAERARIDPNGEVSWPLSDASAVVEALADAGRLVLGLDIRDYSPDGTFHEFPWSDVGGEQNVGVARDHSLAALQQHKVPGDWVLITWQSGGTE